MAYPEGRTVNSSVFWDMQDDHNAHGRNEGQVKVPLL